MATAPSSFVNHHDEAHATNTHQLNPTLTFSQAESPLNTLIRRTSSRRVRATAMAGREQQRQLIQQQRQQQQRQNQMAYADAYGGEEEESASQQSTYYDRNTMAQRSDTNEIYPNVVSSSSAESTSLSGARTPKTMKSPTPNLYLNIQPSTQQAHPSLSSPLLHSRFLRDSVATTSSNGTNPDYDTSCSLAGTLDMRASTASSALAGPNSYERNHSSHLHPNIQNQLDLRSTFQYSDDGDDTASDYQRRYFGTGEDDDRSSMYSQATNQTARSAGPALRDSWRSTDADGTATRRSDYAYPSYRQGGGWSGLTLGSERGPSPYGQGSDNGDEHTPSPGSPLPMVVISSPSQNVVPGWSGEGEESTVTPTTVPFPSTRAGRTPIIKPITANFSRPVRSAAPAEHSDVQGERVAPQLPPDMREQKKLVLERNARKGTRSPSPHGPPRSPPSEGWSTQYPIQPQPPSMGGLHPPGSQATSSNDRSASPVSLYSNYSYYQFDSAAPSPTGSQFGNRKPPLHGEQSPNSVVLSLPRQSQKPKPQTVIEGKGAGPRTAEDYLQLGIQHHEANRLQESVRCFERSANEGGGCGVGMLMYGLALRHGWGCAKNERMGFKWLRKAAESAVDDLERVRTGGTAVDSGAVQTELVLAIYEVGQCFFHGWGVTKDQKMGVSYYTVAARLGDGDAQGDLAFCLANGKGCKKDKKEAAKWYRRAVEQGQSNVGLAWIYKEKYQ